MMCLLTGAPLDMTPTRADVPRNLVLPWSAGLRRRASWLRARVRKARGDVRVHIHGASLLLPFDHALPEYSKLFPEYSRNVVRVAEAVSAKYPGAPFIDVGANVGDTTGSWRAGLAAPILSVEGDPHWLPYLVANAGSLPDVHLAPVFLGAKMETVVLRADRLHGTSAFVPDDAKGTSIEVCTPRQLLARFPSFRRSRLVKTDTDGYDYSIVSSFVDELVEAPVFFFEHDPSFGPSGRQQSAELRQKLVAAGYRMALWWDNFGRFALGFDLRDESIWNSLTRYAPAPAGVHYWDVAAFPETDSDMAESVRLAEMSRL